MTKRILSLNSRDKVKKFVNIVNKYEFDVDLGNGRCMIDAKSIMGVFSLDLSKHVECTIHTSEHKCSDLLNEIAQFCVNTGR